MNVAPHILGEVARVLHSCVARGGKIVILTGAGISVAAGIPDFRSPGGMYDTLRPELLTATEEQRGEMKRDPTTVVSWNLFRVNQLPYLELRRPFILNLKHYGRPTVGHFLGRILQDEGVLDHVLTQNIDGLDYRTGLKEEKIINVHGSLRQVKCEFCEERVDYETFCAALRASVRDIYNEDGSSPVTSSPIPCPRCGRNGLKPATVLYGRNLPQEFFQFCDHGLMQCDVLLVMGTSLTVFPAADVPELVPRDRTVRILFNKELVGSFGKRKSDIYVPGDIETNVSELCKIMGWGEKLEALVTEDGAKNESRRSMKNNK